MGAFYGQQSLISRESWTKMLVDGLDISITAGYSGLASINASLIDEKNITSTFQKLTTQQNIYTRGAVPPKDGNPLSWTNQTKNEPNMLSISLQPIYSLPIDQYANKSVKVNLKKALKHYCYALKEEREISSCNRPTPDPPAPKPRTNSTWSNDNGGADFPLQVRIIIKLLL